MQVGELLPALLLEQLSRDQALVCLRAGEGRPTCQKQDKARAQQILEDRLLQQDRFQYDEGAMAAPWAPRAESNYLRLSILFQSRDDLP